MYTEQYGNSAVHLREYEKLFIGSNQDQGYENPCLGFNAETTQQIFMVDSVTYFHYPQSAQQISLSSSGLIEAGAVSGPCPYYSDKVWKKMANYKQYVNWGNASPEIRQTGVWLCAWLSGNEYDPSQPPIWKERWYNPGYINLSGAYTETTPTSNIIVDLDATLTFEPGVLYKYFHVGNQKIQENIDNLSLSGELRVHFDDWTTYFDTVFYKVSDVSGYSNNGIIQEYDTNVISTNNVNTIEYPDDNTLYLNGTGQCVKVVFDNSFNMKQQLTVSFWGYAQDWNNIQGSHIVSDNFRGGWDVKYTNGFSNPFFALYNQRTGVILVSNIERSILTTKQLPGTSIPVGLAIDYNRYIWVIDNGDYENGKNLYKLDFNGDIILHTIFPNTVQMQDLAIDSNSNIWVLASGQVSGINSFGIPFSAYSGVINANRIDVTKDNIVRTFSCDDVCIDEQSNAWIVSGGNVYKETTPILTGINATNIGCDKNNNIWVLFGSTEYVKLSSSGTMMLSGFVSTTPGVSDRGIMFTNEIGLGQYNDYIWISQNGDSCVYKVDMSGKVVQKLNALQFDNYIPYSNGDGTGYDWRRKFNYLKYNKQPQIQSDIYLGTDILFQQKYTLTYPTSNFLGNDWHMFTFTYDSSANKFDYYVDSVLRDSVNTLPSTQIYYEYENPIIIGCNVGHVESLGTELKTNTLFFKGNIDDLRIYNRVLNISDIRRIYFSKYKFKDLVWNMPTGLQNYLEEIERFFKFKLPGQKAQYYNIRLIGLGVTELDTRLLIEDIIRTTVKKIAPAHAELLNIIWE